MTHRELIERYNDDWNAHDLDAIVALHAPEMVFETTPQESAREATRSAATSRPSSRSGRTCRSRCADCGRARATPSAEWTATATHERPLHRGDIVAEPTGSRISWHGVEVFTIRDGLIARKDVYSDSVTILRAVGLLA